MSAEAIRRPVSGLSRECGASVAALLVASLVGCAGSSPLPDTGTVDNGPSRVLSGQSDALYNGIGRITGRSICTAVLLDSAHEDQRGASAFVATNGHCAGTNDANRVIVDAPGVGDVTFNFFQDTAASQIRVPIATVRYATMKGHDLAIVELGATLAELKSRGLRPWRIGGFVPPVGAPIAVVGAPLQNAGPAYLRLSSCQIDASPALVLERQWQWSETYRTGCRDIQPGSSGSPAILRDSGWLIGLVNTTTIGSGDTTDCWAGRPCEAAGKDGRSLENATYVIPLLGVERCFDERGRFDRLLEGCGLDRAANVAVSPTWIGPANPFLPSGPAGPQRTTWEVRIEGPPEFRYFRYKTGPAGDVSCRSEAGYGPPLAIVADSRVDDRLPTVDGFYTLCVLGGPNAEPSSTNWQRARDATAVNVQIDTVPPRDAPRVSVEAVGGSWRVFWYLSPPELAIYIWKSGPPGAISCDDPAGYSPLRTDFATLSRAGGPLRVCTIALDEAGNPTPPYGILLQ